MLKQRLERCRGAAMVEFHVVALLALLPLCLGTLQIALLLVDGHHLDHAAFLAARQAAVMHGDLSEARRAYVQAASTLFVDSSTPVDKGNVAQRVATAFVAATLDVNLYVKSQVLAPDSKAQADFRIRREGRDVIPNDALATRSAAPGRRSRMSLQEANILRIEFVYCRPLIVPFAGPMLVATLRRLDFDPWHQRCYAAGRVPVRSEGVAPMQSDFRVTS